MAEEVLSTRVAAKMPIEEVQRWLKTDALNGLSEMDVRARSALHGFNELLVEEKEPVYKKYIDQFKNPLILLLLASAAISVLTGQLDDAVSITVAILIVVTVAFVQEYRSEKSLEELNKLVPHVCSCIRDSCERQIFARDLVPGDVVTLNSGDRVPADIRLFEAVELEIDESSFTGETVPARKWTSQSTVGLDLKSVNDLKNIVFMGTLVQRGRGKGIVIGTGHNSEFGDVFGLMKAEASPKTPLQKSMDHLGKQLSFYSFAIIIFIFLIGVICGRKPLEMFTIAVSLAVAAIPEGLPIVVTVTLALGVTRMARRRVIVKKLPTVETLGCVSVICCDKTGTLTKNEMTAVHVIASDGTEAEVFGVGYSDAGGLCTVRNGEAVIGNSHPSISRIIQIGCVCNSSTVVNGELRGQPTEGALIVLAKKAKLFHVREEYKITEEMPFSSETKWMAVRCYCAATSSPAVYYVKGATDRILAMCSTYLKNGQTKQLDLASVEIFQNDAKRMASGGLRVIAFAQGLTMGDLVYVGMVGLLDPPRAGVRESVETVRSTGVQVKMITGDALETATAVAERLCLCDSGNNFALSGEQLDQMNTVDLERVIGNVSIFYRASPKHKLKIVKSLQDLGHVVAMTGDGVNDAVALKKADIGIAMGTTGTDVSKEAADMILITDDFSSIRSKSIDCCSCICNRRRQRDFQQHTQFCSISTEHVRTSRILFDCSIAALSLIALSTVFQLPNPLNAMQILWINIIMDGPPAQSLGVEPVDKEIISQPPRNVQEPMLTKSVISSIVLSSLTIITGTMWIFIDQLSDNKITPRDTTMTFTLFVFFDMWNALSCRSQKLISDVGFFRNRMFLISVFGSIVGQFLVIYLPALQAIFQTEALHFQDIVLLVALSSTVFFVSEAKKLAETFISRAWNLHDPFAACSPTLHL
ncbi:Calcium-transporting ATPase type 2C member 1 [Trichinella sp. T8]|nr:Calcium-transporting ATPase type 2C member 1 [Trichinella sp. T8]